MKKHNSNMKKEHNHEQKEEKVENSVVEETASTGEEQTTQKAETISTDEKLAELNDKYLRLQAEFDNYRKRTLKERMELMKTAGEDVLVGFLPVLDNIERASKLMENVQDVVALKEGVDIILKELSAYLKQKGIQELKAEGEVFNTDLHNAVTKFPVPDEDKKGKVIDVVRKGYTLHDKVIRFAEVVVGE